MQRLLISFAVSLLIVAPWTKSLRADRRPQTGNPDDAKDQPSVTRPAGAVVLFDGKSLDGWTKQGGKAAGFKLVDGDAMQVAGGDIVTKQKFDGAFKLHVEFRVPYMPNAKGQGRGNSGVYLQGRYEVQVLDSYGLKSQNERLRRHLRHRRPARQRLQGRRPFGKPTISTFKCRPAKTARKQARASSAFAKTASSFRTM